MCKISKQFNAVIYREQKMTTKNFYKMAGNTKNIYINKYSEDNLLLRFYISKLSMLNIIT